MKKPLILAFTTALTLVSLSTQAATLNFSGTTFGTGFNRPTDIGDQLSAVGTSVPFFVETFTVSGAGLYNFGVVANDPSTFDTFAFLYLNVFNPSTPLVNYIAGNDDKFSNPDLGSGFNSISLQDGGTYSFVVTGFGDTDYGAFSGSISGPGILTPVPEPSAIAIGVLGAAALALRARKSNR